MRKFRGFTLIELLVVIAIIAILAVLIIMALNAARLRARDTARKSDLRSVQTGLELYNDTNGGYPADGTGYAALEALLPEVTPWPTEGTASQTAYGFGTASPNYTLGTDLENDGAIPASQQCGAGNGRDYCVGTVIDTALVD